MDSVLAATGMALWLGILTSISPCPLATNLAAMSFIGRRVGSPWRAFLAGLFYTLGRTVTYVALGTLLVASLLHAPGLSQLLQKYMNKILGPILIIVGMVLLDLIRPNVSVGGVGRRTYERLAAWGLVGALPLGILFALSFCPVSAALFFGSLIPAAIQLRSGVIIPSLYGIGTALPVLLFAALIAAGAHWIGVVFNRLTQVELWARRVTGIVFVIVGVHFCLKYIFGVFNA